MVGRSVSETQGPELTEDGKQCSPVQPQQAMMERVSVTEYLAYSLHRTP
jgi:hypothetical protein